MELSDIVKEGKADIKMLDKLIKENKKLKKAFGYREAFITNGSGTITYTKEELLKDYEGSINKIVKINNELLYTNEKLKNELYLILDIFPLKFLFKNRINGVYNFCDRIKHVFYRVKIQSNCVLVK